MTAIEKSNSETQKGVAKLQEIFKGNNKKSRFRMGIAANMLQEYMAQFDPTFEAYLRQCPSEHKNLKMPF